MPSLRPIAAAVAALLLAPAAGAVDVPTALAERFSIGGLVRAPAPPPGLTLLDPTWLLPPIESLDTAVALANGSPRTGPVLRDDTAPAAPGRPARTPGRLLYPLSDHLSAQLRYRRSQSFDRAGSRPLRDDQSTAFSTLPNRDVFDLNMSWRLAGSTVGLGYQLQSSASGPSTADAGVSRFFPGNERATHSLMLGLTREWGAGDPAPVVVGPLLLAPDFDMAETGATPTPAP